MYLSISRSLTTDGPKGSHHPMPQWKPIALTSYPDMAIEAKRAAVPNLIDIDCIFKN